MDGVNRNRVRWRLCATGHEEDGPGQGEAFGCPAPRPARRGSGPARRLTWEGLLDGLQLPVADVRHEEGGLPDLLVLQHPLPDGLEPPLDGRHRLVLDDKLAGHAVATVGLDDEEVQGELVAGRPIRSVQQAEIAAIPVDSILVRFTNSFWAN